MKHFSLAVIACASSLMASVLAPPCRADVESGPAIGAATPALTVFAVTGEVQDKELDYAAERGEKPTMYLFVPADRWGRPTARLVHTLDKLIADAGGDGYAVAVWLTDDAAKAKEYLPRAQMSLQLGCTALTVYSGDKPGPDGWSVNSQADITVVIAAGGKVTARSGFVSPNETLAREVGAAWKRAVKPQ